MSQEVAIVLAPLLIVMVIVSIWGWMIVPSDARFRGRLGIHGTDFTVGKGTGFTLRLVTGIICWAGASMAAARGWEFGQAVGLGAVALVVLLIGQISAIRRARPHS